MGNRESNIGHGDASLSSCCCQREAPDSNGLRRPCKLTRFLAKWGEEMSICLGRSNSLFGEDAFYREAKVVKKANSFIEDAALEQARLKMHKGTLVAKYAAYEVSQQVSSASIEFRSCIQHHPEEARTLLQKEPRRMSMASVGGGVEPSQPSLVDLGQRFPSWLRTSIPEWTQANLPGTGEGPYWCRGHGLDLKVRCGPDYLKTYQKTESDGTLYEAISCDAIKSSRQIDSIMGNLVHHTPRKEYWGEGAHNGFSNVEWTQGDPLPRVICINMMMPYRTGLNPWAVDPGCNFVGFFQIRPETLQDARSENPPPGVRVFRDFCAGPCGRPGDPSDPNRSLRARVDQTRNLDQQAGLFKAMARCENPEEVNIPDIFHKYNGQPCLITKCGYIVKDPAGEWMEIGIDVRGFNVLARTVLEKQRHQLPHAKIHYAFLIQAMEDFEMPEKLLCDMYVCGMNMVDDPRFLGEDELNEHGAGSSNDTAQ